MFKALIAVSLAMLVCCCAAAWAGQAQPIVPPADGTPSSTPTLSFDIAAPEGATLDRVTFASAQPDAHRPMLAEHDRSPELPPPAQAVIPLPAPLYAAAALAPLAWLARRAILRARR